MAQFEEWEFYANDVDVYIYWYKKDNIPNIEEMRMFYEFDYFSDQQLIDGVHYTFFTKEEFAYITGKDYEGPEPVEPRQLPETTTDEETEGITS